MLQQVTLQLHNKKEDDKKALFIQPHDKRGQPILFFSSPVILYLQCHWLVHLLATRTALFSSMLRVTSR